MAQAYHTHGITPNEFKQISTMDLTIINLIGKTSKDKYEQIQRNKMEKEKMIAEMQSRWR